MRSRREVLRGLGVGLGCLPLLRATPSFGAPPPAPRRFVCVLQPFGYRTGTWLPGVVGPMGTAALPDATSPLAPYKDLLIFLPGLTNPGLPCGRCGQGAYGATFGVARAPMLRYAESGMATVDQRVAAGIARQTALAMPSLPLGVMVDSGRTALPLGGRRCFWRGAGQPVDPEESPHALYARLFAGSTAAADDTQRLLLEKRSLLDYVGVELERYARRLGTEDRFVIQAHQDAIRQIEQGLAALPPIDPTCPPRLGAPVDARRRRNFAAVAELQLKMAVAALTCDLTRVVTVQLGDAGGSGISLDFVPGMPQGQGDWARIARTPAGAAAPDAKRLADKWFMTLFARLLTALSAGPAGATLLDQSAVLWATTMNDGADGDAQRLPWLLAGKCGGYFKTGQVAGSAGKPLHGVLAEICNAMQVPVELYGDRAYGTPMAGLKA